MPQGKKIFPPPKGYRILAAEEIIKEGDIEEASWSTNGWNNGVSWNEIGRNAGQFEHRFARKWAMGAEDATEFDPALDDEYAFKTIEEFEKTVGYGVNRAFRVGWQMARIKNGDFRKIAENDQKRRGGFK